jgi:hypothetical protein
MKSFRGRHTQHMLQCSTCRVQIAQTKNSSHLGGKGGLNRPLEGQRQSALPGGGTKQCLQQRA